MWYIYSASGGVTSEVELEDTLVVRVKAPKHSADKASDVLISLPSVSIPGCFAGLVNVIIKCFIHDFSTPNPGAFLSFPNQFNAVHQTVKFPRDV